MGKEELRVENYGGRKPEAGWQLQGRYSGLCVAYLDLHFQVSVDIVGTTIYITEQSG